LIRGCVGQWETFRPNFLINRWRRPKFIHFRSRSKHSVLLLHSGIMQIHTSKQLNNNNWSHLAIKFYLCLMCFDVFLTADSRRKNISFTTRVVKLSNFPFVKKYYFAHLLHKLHYSSVDSISFSFRPALKMLIPWLV
jgi:hypothetical protein